MADCSGSNRQHRKERGGGGGGTAYKMTMLHYGGTSREKQNWVKGEEMLLFIAIFADKYIKGHILESRFTC